MGGIGAYFVFGGLSYGNVKGMNAMEDWKSTGELISRIGHTRPIYVYHPAYVDALYYYVQNKERIKPLNENAWEEGPEETKFILVDMSPENIDSQNKIVKDIPFLQKKNKFQIKQLGRFPHILVYEITKFE